MKRLERESGPDDPVLDALRRIQTFLAIVLAERSGPLTPVQRDLLQSASTAAQRAEQHILGSRS